jgi:hypothetical protein
MHSRTFPFLAVAALLPHEAECQSLRGSRASVDRQYEAAISHDFTFLEKSSDVSRFARLGYLVPVAGGSYYQLAGVSFAYARPEVLTFVERLSSQYHSACGEPLVVTSLTRPERRQPLNASSLSVHPTGMAVDLRVSRRSKCRTWLERTLLALEKEDVIEATRERRPAHYHVAVYPEQYSSYVAGLTRRGTVQVARARASDTHSYRVNRGDSLWSIARRYGTSVETLKEMNGLSTSRIAAGQKLMVPAAN